MSDESDMTKPHQDLPTVPATSAPGITSAPNPPVPRAAMTLDNGTTTVAPAVVAKIAALAAREVAGVHSLGVGSARSVTAVRDRIPGASAPSSAAVSVEVGQTQAAIDLDLIVEYGTPITDIARDVRRHVIGRVEEFTGLQVVEVNITVDDIKLPTTEASGSQLT